MPADIGCRALVAATGAEESVETMRVAVGKVCTTSNLLLTLSIALFAVLPGGALVSGGTMPMPADIAFASPTALEAVASGAMV